MQPTLLNYPARPARCSSAAYQVWGSGNAAHCAASPAPWLAELHTPLPHILEMLQVKYRGKFDTAWNLSRWEALLDTRVEGRRVVSGFRSSCHVLSRGRISTFLVCSQPPLLVMSKYYFSALPAHWEGTFCNHCFCEKMGGWLAWHDLPSERDKSAWTWRELVKPLHAATSQKGEKKKSSENLENTSRFIKCHGEPYGTLVTHVSCCKA